MANRVEAEPTLIEESQVLKERSFLGWLAVIEGILQGEVFHLYEGRNRIGSSPQCDIHIPDEGVQDQHLSIRFSSSQWMLTDLDSETGTFLNGKRIYRNELKDGDKIKIGKAVLQIKLL
jgi:pSer/pThr/pTyr-binding forkhead associated (FHA) protein